MSTLISPATHLSGNESLKECVMPRPAAGAAVFDEKLEPVSYSVKDEWGRREHDPIEVEMHPPWCSAVFDMKEQ